MNSLLTQIKKNNKEKAGKIRKLMVILNPMLFALGDNVVLLSYMKHIKSFFDNCILEVTYQNSEFHEYESLLLNNPHVDRVFHEPLTDIDYNAYDCLIVLSYKEVEFLQYLSEHHSAVSFQPAVYSYSTALDGAYKIVFPMHDHLVSFIGKNESKTAIHELYISEEETAWGNSWLESQGVTPADNIVVILDESGATRKLLKTQVHFAIVEFVLTQPNTKILIFDRKNIGKELFYKEWLGKLGAGRIIVGKELILRQTLSILSSRYIKIMFGPCTGLLHCGAGVCGSHLSKGASLHELPKLIVYTGTYPKRNGDALTWWGKSLVDCWILKKDGQHKKSIVKLKDIKTRQQMLLFETLWCDEYEAPLLISNLREYMSFDA